MSEPLTFRLDFTIEMDPLTPEQTAALETMAAQSRRRHLVNQATALCWRLFHARVAAGEAGDARRFGRIWRLEAKAFWRMRRRCLAL